ncbi:hypothetical protein [Hymenobacter chitinivorans]|uniref:Uncharacterized protein n=1 Tax=Hymenobacter chitinivorans DSM 11115 TaxID=1121954 RepID=A0A2M9BTI1_9BACT|nr:hypothetical protein [Hymenobacter chitinivorans]PJJ61246.1 hypothetical protein CLV45_2684 [Hymenobacter chitinivorans DSM 11115]
MKYVFLFLLLLGAGPGRAQQDLLPLDIAQRFVAREGWPELHHYLCGEVQQQAKSQTLGQQIPAHLRRTCALVQQTDSTAVVAVELRDSLGGNDFYLHFRRQNTWQLQAVRGLGMTNFGRQMLTVLEGLPPAERARYNQTHPKAEYDFTVGNIRLWVGSDADIAAHFTRRQADFEKTVRLLQTGTYFAAEPANEAAANADPAINALLKSLFISRVTRKSTDCDSCFAFVIGGLIDNTVGLLYEPDASKVPAMSPGSLIVLKPLGKGWYLFKTT